jgi:hypothetical protein
MRLLRLPALIALLGALLGVAILSSPVAAAAPAGTLTLQAGPAPGRPQAVQLTARLLGADGRPVGSEPVTFTIRDADFGGIQVPVGSATTNTAGLATVTYTPRWTGTLAFTAQLGGDATLSSAPATAAFAATSAVPAYHVAPAPLAGLRFGVAWAIEALTVAVWLMLAIVLISVVRGLPRLAAAVPEAGELEGAIDSAEASRPIQGVSE